MAKSNPMFSNSRDKILCVVGRTGVGKDSLVKRLCEEYPNLFNEFISYTDRPQRNTDIDGYHHWFITTEEFNKMKEEAGENGILAYTKIYSEENPDGAQYMCLKSQMGESNVYIIDPKGIKWINENFPDIKTPIINIRAHMSDVLMRCEDRDDFDKMSVRMEQENEQFDEFEKLVDETYKNPDNGGMTAMIVMNSGKFDDVYEIFAEQALSLISL